MKKTHIFFYSIFLVFSLNGQNIPQLYKKCLPAIVKISAVTYDGVVSEGTGFFIGEKTIVTCYHVADNLNTIEIQTSDGKKYTTDSIVACNKKTDLIKFTVIEKNENWLKLSDKLPIVGENIYIIGNPDDYDFSLSSGIVSSIRMKDSVQVIQNTAPCSPGSSGSPLLDQKGRVVGIMSYVKYVGQNLNFAATSINAINIINDKTIKHLTPIAAMITRREMDSIITASNNFFKAKDYRNALNSILPVTKFADTTQSLKFTELIGDCHLFLQDYSKASQYYEHLIKSLYNIKKHNYEDVWTFAQTLQKQAFCYFILGDKNGAIDMLSNAAEISKGGLEMDASRKQVYTFLIQQIYTAKAYYQYSMDKVSEACLSWKIAKQYGYKKDEYGFEEICK